MGYQEERHDEGVGLNGQLLNGEDGKLSCDVLGVKKPQVPKENVDILPASTESGGMLVLIAKRHFQCISNLFKMCLYY